MDCDCYLKTGIALAADGIHGHDFRVQVVGERNDREHEGNEADYGDALESHAVPRNRTRHTPAETPDPQDPERDRKPNQIENRLGRHRLG